MAAPVPESVASATGTSGTSVEVSKPSGTVDGDWLIAVLAVRDTPQNLTAPAGWSNVVNELISDTTPNNCLTSVWKKKASSEGSSYTFSWSNGDSNHTCTISRYSGGDSTDIIDAVATQDSASQAGTDIVCPAVTTSTADCLIVRIAAQQQGDRTRTAPGSHTERWNFANSAASSGVWQGGATATQASAGSSGTATWASTSTRQGGGITLALKPAAGGSTFTATAALTTGAATLSASATFTDPTYDGAAALTAPAATLSGSATFATGTFTATAALTAGAATLAATATFVDPTYSGTLGLTVGAATLAGSATFDSGVFSATADLDAPAATLAGAATFTAPVYTGAAALTVGAATLSGAAAFATDIFLAAASLTAPAATLAGVATFTAAAVVTAPGLEYALPANRVHYVLPEELDHYALPANRVHYVLPEEP